MKSQKQAQLATALAQMMSLIQDEITFNGTNLSENYSKGSPSFSEKVEGEDAVSNSDYNDGGNYSVNSSSWPQPTEDDYVPYSMRPETYIVPVVFAIIFIIGVIGNGTLIVIFLKHRTMRNIPNTFIVNLATGDLLVVLFSVPFVSTVYTLESWPYGVVVCKFSEFIKDLSIGVSVFTLTALSADRYFAIVDPMKKLTGRRATRITCITIIGIWLLSILFAIPSLLFSFIWTIDTGSKSFDVCYPFPKELTEKYGYPKVVVMFKFLVYYAIPLCFIATFYIIMAHHLLQSTRNMPGEAQGQLKQIQSRKKVAKMILSFVVIFAICFFPNHLFFIWFYYDPAAEKSYNMFWHFIRILGFCLSFLNSCINPIALYCLSGTFRKMSSNTFRDWRGVNGPGRNPRMHRGSTLNSEWMTSKKKSGHYVTECDTLCSESGELIALRKMSMTKHGASLLNEADEQECTAPLFPRGGVESNGTSSRLNYHGNNYHHHKNSHKHHQHCFSTNSKRKRGLNGKMEDVSPSFPSRIEEETSGAMNGNSPTKESCATCPGALLEMNG